MEGTVFKWQRPKQLIVAVAFPAGSERSVRSVCPAALVADQWYWMKQWWTDRCTGDP